MENYKSLDAYKFFEDVWVQTLMYMKIEGDVFIIRSDVRPSYRTTSEQHKPWVAVKSNGNVLVGHCNCMAG